MDNQAVANPGGQAAPNVWANMFATGMSHFNSFM